MTKLEYGIIIMKFENVDTEFEYQNVNMIATITWQNAYKEILSNSQINYMLNKFLSVEAIKTNIKDGYTYTLLLDNDIRMGFFAYKFETDYIFLSKLYILPNFQGKGLARLSIEHLKEFKMPIRLTVNKYNKNAIKIYEHLGFKRIDSVITDIGNGYVMDDYVYEMRG